MTLTIEKLESVFCRHWLKHDRMGDDIRAGIRAVVEALRDEFREEYGMWERFSLILMTERERGDIKFRNEILGDAGNEKAAGESANTVDAQQCQTSTPLPAADPAVCVWTIVGQGCARWIETDCGMSPDEYDEGQLCYCGKTIKFMTEDYR